MSQKDEKGRWGPAINLGDKINTPGDEEAPYLALDGQTLLFSSDGHPGFGEADIFKTHSEDLLTWATPINLGVTINSPHRETGITLSSNRKEILFSSSRDGSIGGLDIYQLTLDTLFPLQMSAMMLDLRVYNASNREPLKGVAVQIGSTGFEKMNVQTDEKGRQILTDHEFSNHKKHVVERFQYMLDNNITKKSDLPPKMRTKKFNQKPLPARWEKHPTMTVTSLPDDYVHYKRPRTFSVREWARLQTFPDKHIFCGKRTTGGVRRAGNPSEGIWDREVPKYTQIGNAVPPLLGKAIGSRICEILGN